MGVVGEYVGGSAADYATLPRFAHFLLGQNALEREGIYSEVKRALRQVARTGLAPVDIALWDPAGNINHYEMGLVHPKAPASHNPYLYKGGCRDGLDAIDDKGHVPVPQGPGLGVEIDWDWVNKHHPL